MVVCRQGWELKGEKEMVAIRLLNHYRQYLNCYNLHNVLQKGMHHFEKGFSSENYQKRPVKYRLRKYKPLDDLLNQ